ncbi:hypothetical protein C2845_PM15G13960 [Panicum miliaceum]|uniref:Vacuolar ATPase assembly protein VMA22 n=1 Tax=Panicum miliaceum TaxID=4540 RepID=A0A3L6Q6Z0_PANMI|nr:hypothetical protein C2845_PM15G13960 [Panicum miliaceum]
MAAAAEDPRLLGSAPGVEGAGEIDGAVGEQGRPRGDDDEEILRFMDSVDGYLVLMDSLSSALRQGWLDMASARHSMGPSRVTSTLFDHKEQSAATKLQVADHAGLEPSESKPHFALSKWSLQEECKSSYDVTEQASTEPKLRHRGSATTPEDGSHERDATTAESSTGAGTSSHVQRARSKALSVFGALVSPKLRTAQISFETALELIVELANLRSNMLASFSQLKE